MTTVYCSSEECRWNKNGECDRGVITLDCDNECSDFESYLDDAEWQKPYWKRLINKETRKVYIVQFRGKEIEVKGRKFFVDVNSDYATATDEITGLNAGSRCDLESRIDKIIELASKLDMPPLESLPIGLYDEETRRVLPMQGTSNGEGNQE